MARRDYDEKCSLLIIGDTLVGKTSFLSRYAKNIFNLTYLATAGMEFFSKDEKINNRIIRVELWDSSGSEKFQSITSGFFNNAQGIMVMFDVTNTTSYNNVVNWIESIKTHLNKEIHNIPVIIIGNKIDIKEREIKTEDAKEYCQGLGFKYFETSAKTGENVESTIKYIVKEVLKKKNNHEKKTTEEKPLPPKHQKEDYCSCIIV